MGKENMRVLGEEWNANLIRWQITRNWGQTNTERDLVEYDRWLDGKLADLDKGLISCARYGIKVLVDLHSPPGGRYAKKDMAMFYEPVYQDHFVKVWERMARRYKGNTYAGRSAACGIPGPHVLRQEQQAVAGGTTLQLDSPCSSPMVPRFPDVQ